MNMMDLWPEMAWIQSDDLRERVIKTWEAALERSVLTAEDLRTIMARLCWSRIPW